MTSAEMIAIGAEALRAEDRYRRENNIRPYSDTTLRYDVAARIVYEAFEAKGLLSTEVI